MYDLKQSFCKTGIEPIIDTFDSFESQNLYSQWNRIYVFNNNLFREFIDSDDNRISYISISSPSLNGILYYISATTLLYPDTWDMKKLGPVGA